MKGWSPVLVWLILGSALLMLGGCAGTNDEPTIITLWHNYGGQLKETMDQLIDEFNETAGAEAGIIISVTSISGAAAIHEKLVMAANEEPGAPALPDITIAYPKTALLLAEKGLLVELDQFFTPEELAAYLPQFLEEGRLAGERSTFSPRPNPRRSFSSTEPSSIALPGRAEPPWTNSAPSRGSPGPRRSMTIGQSARTPKRASGPSS